MYMLGLYWNVLNLMGLNVGVGIVFVYVGFIRILGSTVLANWELGSIVFAYVGSMIILG